jgi:hypothetical protein
MGDILDSHFKDNAVAPVLKVFFKDAKILFVLVTNTSRI